VSESLSLRAGLSRAETYAELWPQIRAVVADEPDLVAKMANVAAALKESFAFLWVGFYRVVGDELVLGPFQGPLACSRIARGRGVCGAAWSEARTIVVPDVDKFPGHIACSSASRSEIVVPFFAPTGEVVFVLDVDSERLDDFGEADREGLERLRGLFA